MTFKLAGIKILLFLLTLTPNINAQPLKIKSYSIGYRVFEFNAVGSDPTNIAPLLKHPAKYQRYLNTIDYNSLWGNPSVVTFQNFYLNTEWHKNNRGSRFWRRNTVQAGASS